MVLKNGICGKNTGNTLRPHLLEEAKRNKENKITIANGRVVTSDSWSDYIEDDIKKLINLYHEVEERKESLCDFNQWSDLATISSLLYYFIDLDKDLCSGPVAEIAQQVYLDKIAEIIENIETLKRFQDKVDSRYLDLGHNENGAIRITVTYRQESSYDVVSKEHVFRTYPQKETLDREVIRERKQYWKYYWHNVHLDGVQRDTELPRVTNKRSKENKHFQLGWQDRIDTVEFTNYEDINITITEPILPRYIKVLDHLAEEKVAKKCKGQKVKRFSYWNNLDSNDIEEAISINKAARGEIIRRAQAQIHEKAKVKAKVKKHGKKNRNQRTPIPSSLPPRIHIPPGLQPDEVKKIYAREKKRGISERNESTKDNNLKDDASKKAFVTSVSDIDQNKSSHYKRRVSIVPLKEPKKETKVDVCPEKREKIAIWQFVDHISKQEKVAQAPISPVIRFKPCARHKNVDNANAFKLPIRKKNESAIVKEIDTKQNAITSSHKESTLAQQDKALIKRKNGRKRKKDKQKLAIQSSHESEKPEVKASRKLPRSASDVKEHKTQTNNAVKEKTIVESPAIKAMNEKEKLMCEKLENFSDVTFDPIKIVVKSSSLRPSALMTSYGTAYQEGNLFPRMFTLDITDKVRNTVKMFRKLDKPFSEPLCMLMIEAAYTKVEDVMNENNLALTNIKLRIKADMDMESFSELHQKMKGKVNQRLIYPLSKIVEYCVQLYQTLPFKGYQGASLLGSVCEAADERIRSQFDWLQALCQWNYHIYSPNEAFNIFANSIQALSIARPTTSGLCRVLSDAKHKLPDTCDSNDCDHAPVVRLLSCQHAFCLQCLNVDVTGAIARKDYPLTCQYPECATTLDEVATKLALSLPQHKLQTVQLLAERIASHPLWQWCPRPQCGRAVKLGGAGFMDDKVTVMCDCGHHWCFHCLKSGHWPATCGRNELYMLFTAETLKTPSELHEECEIHVITCSACAKEQKANKITDANKMRKHDGDNKDIQLNKPKPENTNGVISKCTCRFEICSGCLDVPDTMQLLSITKHSQGMSTLFFRCALEHRAKRYLWSASAAEMRATDILLALKSRKLARLRIQSSHSDKALGSSSDSKPGLSDFNSKSLVTFQPTPPPIRQKTALNGMRPGLLLPKGAGLYNRPTTSHTSVIPQQNDQKFFLITVQQFVHQCHILLEFVYVYIVDSSVSRKEPDILTNVLHLERTCSMIEKNIHSRTHTNRSVFDDLHELHEQGTHTMRILTTQIQTSRPYLTNQSRAPTILKNGFLKLPPIGKTQGTEKVQG